MSRNSQTLQLAVERHRAGDFRQAEELSLQVLESDPHNADAHHVLGAAALAQGQFERAIEHLEKAVEQSGRATAFRHHLGVALAASGRKEQAVGHFREALAHEPGSAVIHNDLGGALRDLGRLTEAEACCREAIRLDPQMVQAHNNLGNVLQQRQEFDAAVTSFQTAIGLQPRMAEVHFNLGNCYKSQSMWPEAEAAYRQAIALKADLAPAHQGLGAALEQQKRYAEAAASHRRAIELDGALAEAHSGLGVALQGLGEISQAKACYQRALALRPDDVTARYNLATALFAEADYAGAESNFRGVCQAVPDYFPALSGLAQTCRLQADDATALQCVERMLHLKPDDGPARFFRATLRLAHGAWPEGWRDFEFRQSLSDAAKRSFDVPRWDGSPLGGRSLLVHAEYGLGDTLQFVRYLPRVKQMGRRDRIHVEVQRALVPLLNQSGFDGLIAAGDPLPPFDLQIPLMSLPDVFQTTLDSVPRDVPYLAADPRLVEVWRERLAGLKGFKVGIHWQGNPTYTGDRHRSIPLAHFAALAQVSGVTLVSLQKDPRTQQPASVADVPAVVVLDGLDQQVGAFMDTAAVIQNLDLVITSDNAIAHLAGALGAPVWLALSRVPEWRWLQDRADTPWYPTMRLFRQTTLDGWSEVFARMAAQLASLVSQKGRAA